MAFAEPAEQRRLTVLVRIILAIPHLIVLYVLSIASEVVALICWFAALFTGACPPGWPASTGLESLLGHFDNDYRTLGETLGAQ